MSSSYTTEFGSQGTCHSDLVSSDPWPAEYTSFGEFGGRLHMNPVSVQPLSYTIRGRCTGEPAHEETNETYPSSLWTCPTPYVDPTAETGEQQQYALRLGAIARRAGGAATVDGTTTRRCTNGLDQTITETVTTDVSGTPVPDRATSTTAGNLSKVRYERGDVVWLTVRVASRPTVPIAGQVTVVADGTAIRSFAIRAADQGLVRARMPDLPRGKHQVYVFYGGSSTVAPSSTDYVTVTVT